ncbi:MAG: hypothetical protein HY376_00485 [Candidatus Blackburnbacteria bacterium]|nr:hypothetical protein [Candidatus Blackburnbacteria bacterium]
MDKIKVLIILAVASLLTTLVLWLPFILRLPQIWGIPLKQDGMAAVVANYDGPYYIVVAKTLYNPQQIESNFSFPLSPIYYSAHYPLFPLLIRGVATITPRANYPYAMIGITLVTAILAAWVFYLLLNQLGLKRSSLWLSLLFLVLPARFLVSRSIGSPEPLFILLLLSSLLFFEKKNYWLAGLFGALAQATKPPAILLFISYIFAVTIPYWGELAQTNATTWLKKIPWRTYPLLLIPLTLVGLWFFYGYTYGNFLAYFHSGDNIHLQFPPFQIFNPAQTWVGTFWLEEIIWIYALGAMGVLYLIKQKQTTLASFAAVFFLATLFVSHRDLARYSLPLVPMIFVGFNKVLTSREFRWVMVLLIIPLYLFAIAFITNNVTPISDWTPLL